ncbi:hypothetical protein PFICI_03994 [Pestalotiopsis fici W106-1]|uniref:Phosphatidic acid phosphatase type 2/haloperoxidase domain-containing protein n=1 Tax=Pestalotiopsis fici (strain W106-1 / CGMCC3.15140) TaxID=1229662 RepID=W3XIX9_PESFW|nr:uncharacterized protein PFICI_03994 [Pestalotiopsis fici W106-1]ETS85969.1 hypothetical protein PFICI_03994 [Pestalotiopsis fici W106-1]
MSFKLIASYVADWVILIAFGLAGYAINNITPNKHAFSLEDRNISFPLHDDTVSIAVCGIVSIVAPAAIILVVTFLVVPGPTAHKGISQGLIWKRRLWELHASLLGLAASFITTWFIINGMKNLLGKPRPNLLARCQPDLNNIADYVVGGVLTATSDGRLVTAAICQNPDSSIIDEGFRSSPSGHSSISAAGLVYLTLFLATKLGAFIPFLHHGTYRRDESAHSAFPSRRHYRQITSPIPLEQRGSDQQAPLETPKDLAATRKEAAAPPLYLLVITVVPLFTSVYICVSRWYDYQHHGFDIIFSFLIGFMTSLVAFRLYHLPLGRGAGWAWAPRSQDKAFWAGLGSNNYARARDMSEGRGEVENLV